MTMFRAFFFSIVTIAGIWSADPFGIPWAIPAAVAAERKVPAGGLDAFGNVVWRKTLSLSAHQSACIGDRFFGPGVSIEFGVIPSRFGDRVYFRTERKILHEWTLPGADQPREAIDWAARFIGRFAERDTLFLELRDIGEPVFAAGVDGLRMSDLFRHWIADAFTIEDWRVAAELGIPQERFLGPAPEQICMLGTGGG